MQRVPLAQRNRKRLYDYLSPNDSPLSVGEVFCESRVPRGKSIRLHLDMQDWLSRVWFYSGYADYEKATVQLFLKLLESRTCIFDVGAQVGYYTLLAASFLEGRGQVHAFEPLPYSFSWLSKNVHLNEFHCIRMNQKALSEHNGQAELFLPQPSEEVGPSLRGTLPNRKGKIVVETSRFDTYCRIHHIPQVDLVKIDVEGGELEVLKGMGELLGNWLPDIILEVHKPFDQALDEFFQSWPYRKFVIAEDQLKEVGQIRAFSSDELRNYYLSCHPSVQEGASLA